MQIDLFLDREFQNLKSTGTNLTKTEYDTLRKNLKNVIPREYDKVLSENIEKMIQKTDAFLKTKAIRGISTSLAFGPIYINIYGGKSVHGQKISPETCFDVASITKLYTTLLALLLKENRILDFSALVKERCPFFGNLDDYTIGDLLYMRGEIRTLQRMEKASSLKEAEEILKTLYLYDSNKEKFVYTDMGLIALTKVIEAEFKRKVPISLGFAGVMRLFLLEPLKLYHTTFFPKENIAGNGREDMSVHDPKARALGGPAGSAGLFVNGEDLYHLSEALFQNTLRLKEENVRRLSTPIQDKPKGIGGIYQKNPDFSKTYAPREYSRLCFASEGTTGSVAIFDRYHQIHNAILVDSIDPETGKKPDNFKANYNRYQQYLTSQTLELYLLSKYHADTKTKKYILKM